MHDLPKGKKILCIDFDGVIHSYVSGWQGARRIPDPPVVGSLEFLVKCVEAVDGQCAPAKNVPLFDVCIYSSRSRYFGARHAMKRWLLDRYMELAVPFTNCPAWLMGWIARTAFADPWAWECEYGLRNLIRQIRFPTQKPAAFLTIDDRAWRFHGKFPTIEQVIEFTPWWKGSKTCAVCSGSGSLQMNPHLNGPGEGAFMKCTYCNGTGEINCGMTPRKMAEPPASIAAGGINELGKLIDLSFKSVIPELHCGKCGRRYERDMVIQMGLRLHGKCPAPNCNGRLHDLSGMVAPIFTQN